MLRLLSLLILTVVLAALPLTARADQAAYVAQDVADKAAALIPTGTEIRNFCEPCGDTEPTPDTVSEVKVAYTGSENFYEVLVNGKGIDLAYVYVLIEGVWTNLAMHLGVEVSDVSATLSEKGEDGASGMPDFNEFHFVGTIGDRKVQANLWRTEGLLQGAYQYLHVGQDIQLSGEVDPAGRFTLTEYIEEDKTGAFNGTLDKDYSKLSGKWVSGDATRTLDFTLTRVAMWISEESTVSAVAGQSTGALNYPLFTSTIKGYEELNKTIAGTLQGLYREHVNGFLANLTEGVMPAGEDDPANNYEFNLGDYSFDLISDQLISLVFNQYEFTGGAHGNSFSRTLNLQRGPGDKIKSLELANLFTDAAGALPTISAFLLQDLKKQEAAWVVDGQTTAFKLEELASFSISARGITFYFDPYAVGPHAQGQFRVTVPFPEVASFLNKDLLPKEILPKGP